MRIKWPFVTRHYHEEIVEVYEGALVWSQGEFDRMRDRINYLEREREAIRQASIANADADKPITILDPPEHDEDIARWENEGGA